MGAILTAGLMLEHLGWARGGAAHRGRRALGGGRPADHRATSAARLGTREVGGDARIAAEASLRALERVSAIGTVARCEMRL